MTNITNQRSELIIHIPRKDTLDQFINQKGPASYMNVTSEVYDFIVNNTNHIQTNFIPTDKWLFSEFIKNSYDSFGEFCLNQDVDLTFKVVVHIKDQNLLIKFKDNGRGFPHHEKSIPFQYQDEIDVTEKSSECFGGEHISLNYISARVAEVFKGSISLKNRKDVGCTVTMAFPVVYK